MGPFRPDPLTEWPHFLILPVKEKTKSTDMKIFKDVFSGDELFSDTYPMKLVDDCMWEVYGKHETRVQGEIAIAGANASAEGADEHTESGVDLVLNHRLVETGFSKKNDYMTY